MPKLRLDNLLVSKGLIATRSQAESYVRLGLVKVGSEVITKPGQLVQDSAEISLNVSNQYVSRAALKLESIADQFHLDFKDKIVLDVGSSTGGFTDFALRKGASRVYAVEKGTNQLHSSLHGNPRIELHEKTDIRDFLPSKRPDVVVIDVSFVSIRELLPHLWMISSATTLIVAMVKPQFEASMSNLKHKGVIKNDHMRRQILKDFEEYIQDRFVILAKADSRVAGSKGNVERFYLLKKQIKK
ncbi:MAG TPA: TlyA family RNA methyltransferase [Candidatus Saccharimonadales bacterium]|nr:TlyA family RNA methyltransferase [Candidatus Saccharimonadales bacterium]